MTGYEKASEIASRILRESGINGPAVPVVQLCLNYGLNVEVRPLPRSSAVLYRAHRTIIVSSMRTSVSRWHIAHELGHWLLPAHFGEVSCNTFAECLLVPQVWLRHDLSLTSEYRPAPVPLRTELANRYGVTESVIRICLQRIGFTELKQQCVVQN